MNVEFKTEEDGLDFMSFLMSQNNQGHKPVLYGWGSGNSVDYHFNDVIHDDIYEKIDDYLKVVA